jgi:RNA ligase (TIGR02306 family)
MNTEIEMTEVIDRNNLAVVAMIDELIAIPNKDRIELVKFKNFGYDAICEKGHQVGDLVMFVKYDSVLPKIEMFDFMKETKYRVKQKSFTERDDEDFIIRKIYSQGIVLPLKLVLDYLNTLPDSDGTIYNQNQECGLDLTHELGVKKYIAPVQKGGGSGFGQMQTKGDFPNYLVSKTDEVNLASKVRALDEIQGMRVYITLKIEGSSLTTLWDNEQDELMVCSRNNQIGEHETNKFWQAVNKYNLKEKLKEPNINIAIQAECYGSGIKKNKLGIEGVDMATFNIIEKGTKKPLDYDDSRTVMQWLGIPAVPLVMIVDNFNMTFDELQELADKQVYLNGEIAEGIVVRPCEPFISKCSRDWWSFKIINREYKL